MVRVTHDREATVLAFVRRHDADGVRDRIFAAFNLSATEQVVTLAEGPYPGRYRRIVDGEAVVDLVPGEQLRLGPWSWLVLAEDRNR
jgi:hypothetical protein